MATTREGLRICCGEKVDVEGSGDRNNGRYIVPAGKRLAVFCHGNGEVGIKEKGE